MYKQYSLFKQNSTFHGFYTNKIITKVNFKYFCKTLWWDAGAVERGGLENRCTRKGTGGSNPPPTA